MELLTRSTKAFTLIEVVIAIAVFMVIIVGSLGANNLTSTTIGINKKRSQANILAKEGMEALFSVRAANFPVLVSGDFHPVFDVNGWRLDPGSEQKGEFVRTIILSPIMRDLYCTTTICDIIPGGGVIDGNSLNATVKVTWKEIDQDKEYVLNTLITYWR